MEKPKKILIVDDEADMRVMFSTRLEISNFEVIEAVDGEEGLEVRPGFRFDRPQSVVRSRPVPRAGHPEMGGEED